MQGWLSGHSPGGPRPQHGRGALGGPSTVACSRTPTGCRPLFLPELQVAAVCAVLLWQPAGGLGA